MFNLNLNCIQKYFKKYSKISEVMVIIWYNFSASVNRYQKRGD